MSSSDSDADPLSPLAEEFAERYRRGERPSLSEYTDRYPDLADRIRRIFPAMAAIEDLGSVDESSAGPEVKSPGKRAPASRQLGDYRILREIGRGGMGVVYEAEQISLGRRVALKVLPDHAVKDDKSLERFRREARAAARLHHTNIVPVHEVGQEGDVCYYAMQFIAGQSLDLVIEELRRLRARSGSPIGEPRGTPWGRDPLQADKVSRLARSLLSDQLMLGDPEAVNLGLDSPNVMASTQAAARTGEAERRNGETGDRGVRAPACSNPSSVLPGGAHLESATTTRRLPYYRSVARVCHQVAQALAHAHARGIVHRDIKPSNLLLDDAGVVWVTDFGLAKAGEGGLTQSGDILGTLRYMAPERFRGGGDGRVDIYALGLTLYELLTLRPAFDLQDRLMLIEQIKSQEPQRPRTIDPRIPRDLETIVLKAIEKDPHGRYPTAEAMAGDLQRFVEDRPVQARRTSIVERAWRWSRRNKALAGLLVSLALVLTSGLIATSVLWARAERNAATARDNATRADRESEVARKRAVELQREDSIRRVALALREIQNDNVNRAEELLQGCPVEHRGWEWHYVNRLAHLERFAYWGHRRYINRPRFGQSIQCLAFSPDGTWIASGAGYAFNQARESDRAEIHLWEPVSGVRRLTLDDMPGTVQSVAVSPDGIRIAAGGGYYEPRIQGWVTVWDAASGKRLWTRDEKQAVVMSVAFSPDGRFLAAGYGGDGYREDGYARVWDVAAPPVTTDRFAAIKGGVTAVSFHPDGQRLVLAGFGPLEIWDVRSRALVRKLPGHTKWVYCAATSPDGAWIASGGFDGTVRFWDASTYSEVRTLYGHKGFIQNMAFSPDSKLLASVSQGRDVKVWEVATGRELATFRGHPSFVFAVAFHPDSRQLASGGTDGVVKIWDVQQNGSVVFRGHTGHVAHVSFSRNGQYVASETGGPAFYHTGNETIKVWSPNTGLEIPAPPSAVTIADLGPEFDPGGRANDGWPDGRIVMSHDRRRIATAGGVGIVKDAETGRVLFTLTGHTGPIWCIAFSPDGQRIATAGHDRTVKIWDANDGKELLSLQGHTHVVQCVAFSHDGNMLVSGSMDTTARIWDARPFSDEELHDQQARRIVFPVYPYIPQFKDELVEHLRSDLALTEPVRAAALTIMDSLKDDPELLSYWGWWVVRAPNGLPDEYVLALRRAETAVRLEPENSVYVMTLGAALYRVGRYAEAIKALDRAATIDTKNHGQPTLTGLAFLAMAHHRTGRMDQARAELDALRARIKTPEGAREPEIQAIHREVEELMLKP